MNGKKLLRGTILTVFCMMAMLYVNGTVSKAYQVVVKSDSTRVRNTASTESDVMTTVNAGVKLEVVSEEQGADGKTWYKVSINDASGYVRSDTVEKAAEGEGASAASPEASSSAAVVSMTSQAATVKSDSVNVRASASTNGNAVATLTNGAAVTLTGTTTDSGGKKWYQVNFINNGSNVTGFIREDFVELGEVVDPQASAEQAAEGGGDAELAEIYGDMPADDQSVNNDYELFYEADAEGVNCWYIHDNVAKKRYKLEQLMLASEVGSRNMEIQGKVINRLKIVLIVLAIFLVIVLAAAVFFGYKFFDLRSAVNEEDDDAYAESPARKRERAEAGSRRAEAVREEEKSARGTVRRSEAGSQRRAEGEGARSGSEQQARMRSEEEVQRRPSGGTARPRSAQSADAPRPRSTQSADAPRPRSAQSADAPRPRSAQPADAPKPRSAQSADAPRPRSPQGPRQQKPAESEAARKSSRQNVQWKSKNFLAEDEDGLDFSFINENEEDV